MLDRYLTKRPGSAYWQLRVPVPKDVQSSFGRAEVTRSLREKDFDRAAVKAWPIIVELKEEWERLRTENGSVPSPRQPSTADLLKLAREAFKSAQNTSQQKRTAVFEANPDAYADYVARQEQQQIRLSRALQGRKLSAWIEPAASFLANRGIAADRDSEWFKQFVEMIAEVTVAAIDLSNRRDRGDLRAEPSSAVLKMAEDLVAEESTAALDVPFSGLTEMFMRQWLASKPGVKVTNTEQQKRATFRLFGGFWNDQPIRTVSHKEAACFRDTINLLHPHWARSPAARELSWHDLIARFGDQPVGLSDGTMNRHMAALQELWRWASKRGHCGGDNPFEGFHTKLRLGVNVRSYSAWELHELQALFDPPPARTDLREVMIVALFTGMRLDEIASLTWGRLRSDTSQGVIVPYFRVDDAKTPAGVRDVPIHHALGWLWERSRGEAHERIWPMFNEEGVGKKPGADASREFSRFKTSRGFTSRTKVFHSFRKNVTRIMERARVPENEWAQVFGHERGFTYAVYNPDGIDLARKAEIISHIEYPSLNIPHPTPCKLTCRNETHAYGREAA